MAIPYVAQVAFQLGLTRAGLEYLFRLKAGRPNTRRGSEVEKLYTDGFIIYQKRVADDGYTHLPDAEVLTEKGLDAVKRARAMGA